MKNMYLKFNWKSWPLLPIPSKGIDYGWELFLSLRWLFFELKLVYKIIKFPAEESGEECPEDTCQC